MCFFVQPLSIYGPCHPTLSLAPKRKHDIDIKYVPAAGAEKNDAVANFHCGSEIKALQQSCQENNPPIGWWVEMTSTNKHR